MLKLTILSLCVFLGGLITITNNALAQTEHERPSWLTSPKTDHFRPIELSVDIFKPTAAYAISRDLYLQAGVAYRPNELHRIRLELGYAQCYRDTVMINIMHSARGSFARFYYTWDLYKIIRIYLGLQGGTYQEHFDTELIGRNFGNYSTEANFKERYGGMLVGVSLQEDMNEWFGLRIYGQTGVYTFNGGQKSYRRFPRHLVPGNGAPMYVGYDAYLTVSVGAELLFYF